MGTLNAIYVRTTGPEMLAALLNTYRAAHTESGSEFSAIEQPHDRYQCPEGELSTLSSALQTDVIWLSFQSVVDAFQFFHWRDGKHLRSLVYGCFENEREWERVEGFPEPWESSVFFGNLDFAVKYVDSEQERREIERIYRGNLIEPGAFIPSLDAKEAARGVADFFNLPGWF